MGRDCGTGKRLQALLRVVPLLQRRVILDAQKQWPSLPQSKGQPLTTAAVGLGPEDPPRPAELGICGQITPWSYFPWNPSFLSSSGHVVSVGLPVGRGPWQLGMRSAAAEALSTDHWEVVRPVTQAGEGGAQHTGCSVQVSPSDLGPMSFLPEQECCP